MTGPSVHPPAGQPGGVAARLQRIRPSQATLIFASVLLAAIILVAVIAVLVLRKQEMESWRAQLNNLSLALAEQTSDDMSAGYLALDSIAERVRSAGIRDAADLRQRMASPELFAMMRDKINGLPQADVATIVAANGDIVNITRAFPAPAINLADRDYFKAHASDPTLGNFISTSVRNRGTGEWVFYISRRINGARGEFAGLVILGMSVAKHTRFHGELGRNLGEGASITLLRRDFTVLARWPANEAVIGKRTPTGTSQQVVEVLGKRADVIYTSAPRMLGDGAQIARLAAVRVLDRYPLLINISVTEDLFLSGWRRSVTVVSLVTLFALVVLLAGVAYLVRLQRRREADMVEMMELGRRAEEASLAKSNFLATMSHEIRTPMNGVIGMTTVLLDSELTPAQRQCAETIANSGHSLLTIINEVLDFSKIEAGKLELDVVDFDLHALIADMRTLYTYRVSEKSLALYCEVAPDVPVWVRGDPHRVRQVLNNYLSNAWKFTTHGAITLRVGLGETADGRPAAHFAVADTGIGIAPQAQARLFEPFSQVDSSSTRRFSGTGLGLAITRQLVELMGGQVGVQSQPDHGATFWALVPFVPGQAPSQPPVAEPATQRGVGVRPAQLLVVEDNLTNQKVAVGLLARLGYHDVSLAVHGVDAIDQVGRQPFDLILMDCHMPVLDGYGATARLRAQGCIIPIIAMTANAMRGDRERCLEAGMNGFIAKPVSTRELAKVLAQWLPADTQAPVAGPEPVPARSPDAPGPLVFDRAGALDRLDGEEDLLAAIVETALEDIPQTLTRVHEALEACQWEALGRYAHSIKGAASNVGAEALRMAAIDLESRASAVNPALTVTDVQQLEAEFQRFRAAYQDSLDSRPLA